MDKHLAPKRIAVIGAGITGLAAAFRLSELADERAVSIDVTVFERGPRFGGAIGSIKIGDYLVDTGADSFLTNKPAAVNLCRRLGIENRLISTDKRFRGAHVLHDGRPVPVPEGFQLLSPTAIWPVMTSPLFSAWGKLRLLMEWFVPPRNRPEIRPANPSLNVGGGGTGLADESLADFVRRRFGREAFDFLVQPLVGGIYTADPERLSLAATMPRFLEMERDYGSLIRASMSRRGRLTGNGEAPNDLKASKDRSSGARYGLFVGLAGGMTDLIEALRLHVSSRCSIRLNSPVTAVVSSSRSTDPKSVEDEHLAYELNFADGKHEQFNAAIIAATADRTADLVDAIDPCLSAELRQIEYASSAIVVSGHQLADIRHPLDSFGLVIPQVERRKILAVSFSSRKFPDRAPEGRVLLRTFVGGAMQPELLDLNDDQLIQTTGEELAQTLGVRGEPDFVHVFRHPRAMAQYHVGHLDRVARIDQLAERHPGLALAGNAYRGVGLPDVIASGEQAAERVFSTFLAPRTANFARD